MMKKYQNITSLYLRVALAATMLSAVADRLGLWGAAGESGVAWGNWENFVAYTADLNAFMPPSLIPFLAVTATALEIIFSLMLLAGLMTRIAGLGTGCLLSLFALAITLSSGIKGALDYSVFIGSAAGFMLASIPVYKYSIDELLKSSPSPSIHQKRFC